MKTLVKSTVALIIGAYLTACGGGGSLATGDLSGTASGTLTGFGSIILNGRGEFETESAEVRIDDEAATESELELGMVVEVDVENADDDFTTGTATQVRVSHEIKGPVTATDPLEVLGQQLVITGDTVIEDNNGLTITPGSFQVGDEVEVSGRRDNTGVVQVSRLEDKAGQLDQWKLMGEVTVLASNTFLIRGQSVNFSGVALQDCDGGLANGVRVEVKAPKPSAFTTGAPLVASEVECKPDTLNAPANLTGTIQGEFEGFVTAVDGTSDTSAFTLGDQPVTRSASTLFEGGTAEDLVVGVKLDAKGIFNTDTGVLDATRIRFRETRFRIEGPLDGMTFRPIPIGPGLAIAATDTVIVLGKVIQVTAQTEVDSNIPTRPGVRVRGFVDSEGNLFANEVDDRSDAAPRLRGPVDNASITTNSFAILGITVDMDSASEFSIENAIVNRAAFVAALEANSEVDVQDGTLTAGTLTNAKLEIENED